jgi:hypothetical protein
MGTQEENMKESVISARKEIRTSESFLTASYEGMLKNYKQDLLEYLEHTLDQYWGCGDGLSESGQECFDEGLALAIKTIKEVLA